MLTYYLFSSIMYLKEKGAIKMLVEVKLFLDEIKANGAAEVTIKNYIKWINRFLKTMNIKKSSELIAIKKPDIQRYRLMLQDEGLSDASINTYSAPILSLFNFLSREDYIEHNPAKNVKLKKVPPRPMTYLTEEESKALIRSCKTKRQKAMFYLMLSTGMRISEVVNVTMEDIVKNKIYINDAKRGETRYIPLSGTCLRLINDYIGRQESIMLNGEVRRDPNGDIVYIDGERVAAVVGRLTDKNYLFTSNTGGKCDPSNINNELKKIAKLAGIKKNISCHNLRATAATIQSVHGTNIKNIQTMLGHKTAEMTLKYAQMVDKNYQKEITQNNLFEEDEIGK